MRSAAYVTLLFVALLGATAAKTVDDKGCVYSDYRLPQRIRPEHYDLWLDVDTDKFTYEGKVSITLTANDTKISQDPLAKRMPDDVIVLHANASISIDDVQFDYLDGSANGVDVICRDEYNELLVITLKDKLIHGSRGELVISFHSAISDDPDYLIGFYKNGYTTKEGDVRAVVSTQFEAASARKAFPCFDEPNFKATFKITLVHDPKLVALSNTAVDSEQTEPKTGRRVTKYKRTPRMSTYLVAYAIGDLEYIEEIIFDGRLTIRAYTVAGKVEQARFALETAVRAITLMEEYFDIPFVMDKIDMVGLPNFENGAMENWGLILYQDFMFLYDQDNSVSGTRGDVATTVVHELAHQWFGNLVTMNWWNDLWLNEGFAAWMQDHFTNQLYPEFEWDFNYLRQSHVRSLETDSKLDTHSIQVEEVGRNIDSIFDDIVYYKSEAILRLIHDDYLGPERFREGIRKYIKRHVYGNTEASDLWSALKETSGLPVDELIKSWVTQPGHPEIEVKLANQGSLSFFGKKKGDKKLLHLKQVRHFSTKPSSEDRRAADKQIWIVPVSLIVADDKGNKNTIKLVMDARETQVELPDWFEAGNSGHWIKLNAGFKGFYRVHYSRDLLMRLEKPCRSKSLETVDRLNLIYDIFSDTITKSTLKKGDFEQILGWFRDDYEGSIVLSQDGAMNHLAQKNLLSSNSIDETLDSYSRLYKQQGFLIDSKEPSMCDIEALVTVFSNLVHIGFEPLVFDALEEFDKTGNKGNVNLRSIVYLAVAKFGSEKQKARLAEFLEETDHPDERERIQNVLD